MLELLPCALSAALDSAEGNIHGNISLLLTWEQIIVVVQGRQVWACLVMFTFWSVCVLLISVCISAIGQYVIVKAEGKHGYGCSVGRICVQFFQSLM